ncbi:hypothetical protein UPYG_G00152630 [Umbra pygmaea]|uniref:Ig-like domain-containing protein n=1 Tax=Umbra pygmaea TaxID=75934 RepID=A0ABD0XHZ6_UMBPY
MEAAAAIYLTLSTLTGICHGQQVIRDSLNGSLGGKVTFLTTIPPHFNPVIITWKCNVTVTIATCIVASAIVIPGEEYKDRITLNISTGSLELRNLALNDNGEYIVNILKEDATYYLETTQLNVYGLSAGQGVLPPGPLHGTVGQAVEFITNLSPPDQPFVTIYWTFNGKAIINSTSDYIGPGYRDRITLNQTTGSLELRNLVLADTGEYSIVITTASPETINGSTELVVCVGPESMTIHGPDTAEVDTSTLLYCSVLSVPPAQFAWLLNGQHTGVREAGYIIRSVSYNNSGEYTCFAVNDLTGKNVSLGHSLLVKGRSAPPLSPEAAAGIAVAGMLVLFAVALGLYFGISYYWKKTTKHTARADENTRNNDSAMSSSDRGHDEPQQVIQTRNRTSNQLHPGGKGCVYENIRPPIPPPRVNLPSRPTTSKSATTIYNTSLKW